VLRRCLGVALLTGLVSAWMACLGGDGTGNDATSLAPCLRELPGFPVILSIGRPTSVAVADLNGDGIPDVALTTFEISDMETEQIMLKTRSQLWVLFGKESDHYELREPVLIHEAYWEGGPALLVRAGNLISNSFFDLVVGDLSNSSIAIFSYEDSFFVEKAFLSVPEPYRLMDFSLADLDENGKVDIVVAGQYGVVVFWNLGEGIFAPAVLVEYGNYGDAIRVASGDVNGDGRLDIGVLGITGAESGVKHWVDVVLNVGNRRFIRAGHVRMDEPAVGVYFVLAAGDVDGDGFSDLVTAYNDRILVLFGSEQGTLTVDRLIFIPALFVPAIILHDLTGDGCLNIIVLTPEWNRVYVSRECYPRTAPGMVSGFSIPFPSPHACAATEIRGLAYLVLAGVEGDEGQSKTVLSWFVGCSREER